MMKWDTSIFRTYDIRGIVDQTLTEEGVYAIGRALGSMALDQGDTQMTVGRDGRLSSPRLSSALCMGILSSGCDVIDLGMIPTPLLYYSTHVLPTKSGVMVTGSHNPPDYNGLKMVISAKTLTSDEIQALYKSIIDHRYRSGQGQLSEYDIVEHYIHRVTSDVILSRPLKIVVDAGNGVAGHVVPMLFRRMGCDVVELFCDVDGHFPYHHPDPSQIENLHDLIQTVKEVNADIGFAFDGDGDRLGVVTNGGDIIWPDRLLMLFATVLLQTHPGAKIIYDVKCTRHLGVLIKKLGGEPIMWKTGHSLIKFKLAETGALLAGEMSGHLFFNDRWYGFDDAIYAGARLLQLIADSLKTSHELFDTIPNSVSTPELKVYVEEHEKFLLMKQLIARAAFSDAEKITIDGLRVNFSNGWGLIRPSNTTPCLVLRFEAESENILANIQGLFRDLLLTIKPGLVLPF